MHILVSNDDGIHAAGIRALAQAMGALADRVSIVAPDRNRSGASNSLSLSNPIHLALTALLDDEPQMVVSGINQGANIGDDVIYSGTVAAAMEGRSLGLPAIAFSIASHEPKHYATAAEIAKILVARVFKEPLAANTILNVNIPDVPFEEITGFEVTRLGTRHRAEKSIKMLDPRGGEIYWIGLPGAEQDSGPGTDFYALLHKKVSITPISVDLTNYKGFEQLASWVNNMDPL
jgi:5'-nucleotidase